VIRVGVFARWPVEGAVRTRLSPALPAALSCRLHMALVTDTLAAVATARADERVLFWTDSAAAPHGVPVPAGVRETTQGPGDPGARLAAAFDAMLAAPADRAVLVGSDHPGLTAAHVDGAFEALAHADLVLGPGTDGGCWLIGLARRAPGLFAGVVWGDTNVFAGMLERAASAQLAVAKLDTLPGLDTPGDLARFVAEGLAGPARVPPATRAALREMKLLG